MMDRDDNILVVGATGNIGSALVGELKQRNANVLAGLRRTGDRVRNGVAGVPAVDFDFNDPRSMKAAFARAEKVFLLLPLHEDMADYARAAIDAARESGVRYVLKSSELGADPDSPRLALCTQGAVDRYLQESGIPFSVLRPNFFMQNFALHYSASIRKHGAIHLPQADAKISFIDVRDIAAVAAQLLMEPEPYLGLSLDLTGPAALGNAQVAQMISAASGRTVTYEATDDHVAADAMRKRGIPEWVIEFVLSLHRHVREGRMERTSTAVATVLGRDPIGFQQFVEDYSSSWRG